MKIEKISKPWYKKWWAITLFIFFGLIVITLLTDNNDSVNEQKAFVPQQENKENIKINKDVKQLDYKIIYELSGKRYDGGKNFYVLVNKVDLNTADFKNDIEKMIDEIVKIKGDKISIDFVNNKEILDLIYKSHYGNNTLGRILTKTEIDKIGQSLIAQFSGQLKTDIYFNTLSFFPGAFTDNPKVGKYIETIEYNSDI